MMLPVRDHLSPQPAAESSADARPTVMIVDDHPTVTRALSDVLDRNGFNAVSFNSGRAAIAYAEDHEVSAVLLDIHMPDMSGLLVSQKLRALMRPDIPIIVLSGDGSMETLNSLPHVGATHFYRKPIKAALLVQHLRTLLP